MNSPLARQDLRLLDLPLLRTVLQELAVVLDSSKSTCDPQLQLLGFLQSQRLHLRLLALLVVSVIVGIFLGIDWLAPVILVKVVISDIIVLLKRIYNFKFVNFLGNSEVLGS